jgi:hypothetical protein
MGQIRLGDKYKKRKAEALIDVHKEDGLDVKQRKGS